MGFVRFHFIFNSYIIGLSKLKSNEFSDIKESDSVGKTKNYEWIQTLKVRTMFTCERLMYAYVIRSCKL